MRQNQRNRGNRTKDIEPRENITKDNTRIGFRLFFTRFIDQALVDTFGNLRRGQPLVRRRVETLYVIRHGFV